MLSQAKKHDPSGVYYEADIRDINKFKGPFGGIFASGCLYHLTKTEFIEFLSSVKEILSDQGILYINMKIGTGNEIKRTPGRDYPGGVKARASLTGPRYYQYYSHEELLSSFSAYSVIKWRNMEVQHEGVHEYWLQHL